MNTTTRRRRSLLQHKSVVTWKGERENILQSICKSIARQVSHGEKVRPLIHRAASRWNGKPFRCDPKRKLVLSAARLLNLYYHWKRSAELPSAFRFRYVGTAPTVPAAVLCRFIEFCAAMRWPSMKAAWTAFARRKGSFRNGQRKSRVRFTYQQALRYFPASKFRALQTQLVARANAEIELGRLRLQYCFKIRECHPDRPRRVRCSGSELSLGSAAL